MVEIPEGGPEGEWMAYTATDGLALRARRFGVATKPRGRALLIHGIQSHSGWYLGTCRALAEAGYEVLFVDRRGSGTHTECRGDTPSWRQIIEDAQAARVAAWGDAPVVVAGISWGGKVALALAKKHPAGILGVALLAPGLCPLVNLPFLEKMAILWARLTNPTRLFPIPLNDPALFTSSPGWQKYLRKDPLALHQATARFLMESSRLDSWLVWQRWDQSVLVQLAGQEKIIDNARTRRWVNRRLRKKQVVEYSGAYHTLEFESDCAWRTHLLAWMGNLNKMGN